MIYISGRITGNKNWEEDFQKAEDYLKGRTEDDIINPLHFEKEAQEIYGKNPTYVQYKVHGFHGLIFCDSIYMLRGWRRSKEARLEHNIAKVLGMKIIYQKRGDK